MEGQVLCPHCSGRDVVWMRSGPLFWECPSCGLKFDSPRLVPGSGGGVEASPFWLRLLRPFRSLRGAILLGMVLFLVLAAFLALAAVLALFLPPEDLSSRSGPDFGTLGLGHVYREVSREVSGGGEDDRLLALVLVNEARLAAGSPPVVLGDNPAAQAHAESMAEHCFLSHWGMDGLKPYMRYSLAGGSQVNGENASGPLFCPDWVPPVFAIDSPGSAQAVREAISDAVSGFLDSPGHRETMLDPAYLKLNLGLAWTGSTFVLVQQFEGDYVEFTVGPLVEDGVLEMAGEVKNGFYFGWDTDLVVFLFYDPPVRPLGRGQLSRTYCYGGGEVIAALAPGSLFGRWGGGRQWTYRGGGETRRCPDPYMLDPGLSAASTLTEARALFDESKEYSSIRLDEELSVPVDGALEWVARGGEFSVRADFLSYLDEFGPGVYTVSLWGLYDGGMRPFAERSLFYVGGDGAP